MVESPLALAESGYVVLPGPFSTYIILNMLKHSNILMCKRVHQTNDETLNQSLLLPNNDPIHQPRNL